MATCQTPQPDLAGRRFMFDYGEIAKFLLCFTHDGMVEVSNLVGLVYSVNETAAFPVEAKAKDAEVWEIVWSDPCERTRLSHTSNFVTGATVVRIEDDRLGETREFHGSILTA